MAHYILVGESKYINDPDIEFKLHKEIDIVQARKRAISLLESSKYTFWAVSVFKNGRYVGMVDHPDRGYRYTSKGKSVMLYMNGTVRE